jgi:4-amino-4-deoxy-L-arabinose transferase
MPHYLIALIHLLLASVFSFLAFKQWQKGNHQFSAVLLVLAAFTLRIFMASDLFLHEWDERYHALVAKNLMSNFLEPKLYRVPLLPYNYDSWSSNYIWLHKQPLPLWCMAISMKLLGVNELAMRLPSVILSSIAVYFTYFIGKRFFNVKVALLAAFFHAINGLVMDVTSGRAATDHIDIFFLFFVEAGMVLSVLSTTNSKQWINALTGLCVGLAVLCKWLPAFIVLPVWVILNYRQKSISQLILGGVVIVSVACIIFMPWQIYMHQTFPIEYADTMLHNYRHMVEVLDDKRGSIFYFLGKLHINVNEVFWPAFIWFCYQLKQRNNTTNRLALLTWMVIPFIFFSLVQTKMQAYLLFAFPALFIMLADFSVFLLEPVTNFNRMRFQKLVFALIIILAVRFSVERIKPFQNQSKDLAWASELKKLDGGSKVVYLNIKHNIEGMFYTPSIMYQYTPEPKEMEDIKARGYQIIINQNLDI